MKRQYLTSVPDTTVKLGETTDAPLLLTPAEAARLLSLAPRTIYALMASRHLPCVRIGRSVRIPRKAVLALAAGETP